MSIGLMESARSRARDGRGMAVSVGVHALVIGLAWYATTGASVAAVRPHTTVVIPTFRPPAQPATPSTQPRGRGGATHQHFAPTFPTRIPPVRPGPITIDVPVMAWDSLVAGPNDMGVSHGARTSATTPTPDGHGVFRTVDEMAEPDSRNPPPVYPAMLRDAGVEGSVSAQFVVDSTGRVIASSIALPNGDNALFRQSVRRALEAARFRPAMVNGRAVPVLMSQVVQFRLER